MIWTLKLILASCRRRSWCWSCLCVLYRLMAEEAVIHNVSDKDLHFAAMQRFIWVLCVWMLHVHVPSCYIENEKAFMLRRVCVYVLFRMCSRCAVCVISRVCTADYSLSVCLNLILYRNRMFCLAVHQNKTKNCHISYKQEWIVWFSTIHVCIWQMLLSRLLLFFYQFIQPWELNPWP